MEDAEFSTPIEREAVRTAPHQNGAAQSSVGQIAAGKATADVNAGPAGPATAVVTEPDKAAMQRPVNQATVREDLVANSNRAAVQDADSGEAVSVGAATDGDGDGDGDIELLSSDPTANWYVRPPSGGQYGPATADLLRSWITEGRVARTALLWRDGWPQWREAVDVLPEVADVLPGAEDGESEDRFAEPALSPAALSPASVNPAKVSPAIATEKNDRVSEFSGDAKIGTVRRKRSTQRMALVAILAALVIGLIVTLILVAGTQG